MSEPTSSIPPSGKGKYQKIPETAPVIKQSSWLGHKVTQLKERFLGIGVLTKEERLQAESSFQKSENEILKDRFEHNLSFLKDVKKEEIPFLQVKNGKLFLMPQKKAKMKQSEEAKQLIKQIYRQVWGTLIDAEHGFRVRDAALKELNDLRSHLAKVYPEVFEGTVDSIGSPLKILSGSYHQEVIFVPESAEDVKKIEELKTINRTMRELRDKRISKLRDSSIWMEPLPEDRRGVNPTEFVKSKQSPQTTYAISKSIEDIGYGQKLLGMRLEMGLTSISSKDEINAKVKKYAQIAGVNEMIASGLNELLEGKLGFPLTSFENGKTTHAYVENQGTIYQNMKGTRNGMIELTSKMPLRELQAFLIGEFALNNLDLHANNILLGKDNVPVGIDFGRVLGGNPLHPEGVMSLIVWDWPQLNRPIDPLDRDFFIHLDVERVIEKLEEMLPASIFSDLVKNKEIKEIINGNLDQLKANLYLLKEAFRQDLNLKEVLSLYFPPITLKEEKEELNFWKDDHLLLRDELMSIMKEKGFYAAWGKATQLGKGKFDSTIFQEEIRQEIKMLMANRGKEGLLGKREIEWYRRAGYFI